MIGTSQQPKKGSQSSGVFDVILLVMAVFLLALYFILRYGGMWGEIDTSTYTRFIHTILVEGKLVPTQGAYANGYGYSVLGVLLLQITGMTMGDLQLYGGALLVVWMVPLAWLLFREFTGSRGGATLATIFLFIQPEFLFPILRGTHEKFSRGLMLLCLYLLLRSIRSKDRAFRFAALLVSFYLAAFALITFNNLISTSFIMSIGLALVLAAIAGWINRKSNAAVNPPLGRMAIVLTSMLVVAFLFTFYAYTPAQEQLTTMRGIYDRLIALFLPVSQKSEVASPYSTLFSTWVSMPIYWLISLANWLLLAISAILWLRQSFRWLRHRQAPQNQQEVLLWAFFGAFALIGAISVVVDLSGALSQNMQLREFPSFAMVAAALVARQLSEWDPPAGWKASLVKVGMTIMIVSLAILSVLKATNEPLLSNIWLFNKPTEMAGVNWYTGKSSSGSLWTEFDYRLSTAYVIESGAQDLELSNKLVWDGIPATDYLISNVTRSRSLRLGLPLPIQSDDFVTYDNGQAQIYHQPPKTPYQH